MAEQIAWLSNECDFPDTRFAMSEPNGLLAAGGDLSVTRLVQAYSKGIFPWFSDDQPILWWSPDPRLVLKPQCFHLSKSLKKFLRQQIKRKCLSVSIDTCFADVIEACSGHRKNQDGTWITQEMKDAYIDMHHAGYAHSVEVWGKSELIGGLYGIALDKMFFGESMFSRSSNASKVALAFLCEFTLQQSYQGIDCQVETDHLLSLGAKEMPRTEFEQMLSQACTRSPAPQRWCDLWNMALLSARILS